ncbi:uncharacterized protein PFL1_01525 [Pseudozyma flocculosa PF-1]|uniref:uncharacterized protein n=1 Tax=Pseudozyma flocculosa PF-1 TaxID=1277687 RepID=UPI0004561394|nr:uncharacterized protein PFL1_01525 [Pseudozyma flocculosa PF-1]EPQ31341.1 hypothetical protein PFL1_01525 [Pseudozyma flocculosa PF-1]
MNCSPRGLLEARRRAEAESQRQGSSGSRGGGGKGGDERAPWQKVLWRPQPYPDNYVAPSFLDQLRTNTSIRLPTLVELVLSSLPISQQFLTTMLFVSAFIHLYSGLVTAPSLLVVSLSASMLAWTTVRVRDRVESSLQRWHRTSSAEPSGPRRTRLQRRRRQQGRRDTNPVLGLVILGFVLLSLSPVLKTLTEATTSDSIWALSTLLFSLHLVLADYRLPLPPPSPPCTRALTEAGDGGGGAGTEGFTSGPPRTLASTLSLNAAVCGSVVLASRLRSDEEVFALVLFAGILFGLGPIWQKRLLSPVKPSTCATTATAGATTTTTTRRRTATLVVYTLLLYATVMASLLPLDTRAPAAFTSLAVAFVSGLCPAWMRWAQRWKMEIKGPWDPAVPVLSNRGRGG